MIIISCFRIWLIYPCTASINNMSALITFKLAAISSQIIFICFIVTNSYNTAMVAVISTFCKSHKLIKVFSIVITKLYSGFHIIVSHIKIELLSISNQKTTIINIFAIYICTILCRKFCIWTYICIVYKHFSYNSMNHTAKGSLCFQCCSLTSTNIYIIKADIHIRPAISKEATCFTIIFFIIRCNRNIFCVQSINDESAFIFIIVIILAANNGNQTTFSKRIGKCGY